MKKVVCLMVLVLLCSLAAFAQDVPKLEWFLGYNYVRVNSTTRISSYSSNGGSSRTLPVRPTRRSPWLSSSAKITSPSAFT